jgi:hypothetical protein
MEDLGKIVIELLDSQQTNKKHPSYSGKVHFLNLGSSILDPNEEVRTYYDLIHKSYKNPPYSTKTRKGRRLNKIFNNALSICETDLNFEGKWKREIVLRRISQILRGLE